MYPRPVIVVSSSHPQCPRYAIGRRLALCSALVVLVVPASAEAHTIRLNSLPKLSFKSMLKEAKRHREPLPRPPLRPYHAMPPHRHQYQRRQMRRSGRRHA